VQHVRLVVARREAERALRRVRHVEHVLEQAQLLRVAERRGRGGGGDGGGDAAAAAAARRRRFGATSAAR
jgi:hypothetical protein